MNDSFRMMATIRGVFLSPRLRNFNFYFLLQAAQGLFSIVLLPVYTFYMSPAEFGIQAACLVWASVIPVTLYLAINDGVYFVVMGANKERKDAAISTSVVFELLVAAAMTTLVSSLLPLLHDRTFLGIAFYPYMYFSLIGAFFSIVPMTYNQVTQAEERARSYSIVTAASLVLNLVVLLYLLVIRHAGALGCILAYMISNIVFAVVCAWLLLRKRKFCFDRKEFGQLLSFSIPLVPHNLAHWSRTSIDRIFLSALANPAALGIYQLALSYAGAVQMVIGSYRDANNPRFFSLVDDRANEVRVVSMLALSTAFVAAISVGMALFGPDIISILTTAAYHEACVYVPYLLSGFCVSVLYFNIVLVLFRHGSTRSIAKITVSTTLLGAALSYVLVRYAGVLGACLSFWCVNLALGIAVYFFSLKHQPMKWPIMRTLLMGVTPLVALPIISIFGSEMSVTGLITKALVFIGLVLCIGLVAAPEIKMYWMEGRASHNAD